MSHSPEPWTLERSDKTCCVIRDANGDFVFNSHPDCEYYPHDDTPERIAACVNACRGVPTNMLQRVRECCISDNGRMLGLILAPTAMDIETMKSVLVSEGYTVTANHVE